MKRILAATDGSEGAGRALDFAANLARDSHAELLIANVIGGYGLPGEIFRRFTPAQSAWLEEELNSHSARVLTGARERAIQLGAKPIKIESRQGGVAQTLNEIAEENGVDVIVVGKRGAGGPAATLLGGAAQKLVNLAECTVIVVA
jgi:nucleotide-binding universal stress UspA family protein